MHSRIVTGDNGRPEVDLFFQIGPLVQHLNPIREQVETPPRDAQVVIRPDDVPIVLPGSNGVKVDDGLLPQAAMAAAPRTRIPLLARHQSSPPPTPMAWIRQLLYTATTFYQSRRLQEPEPIINIHRTTR
jgi:hypothetical protein